MLDRKKLKFPTPLFVGFLQATGIFAYVISLSLFMFNFETIFGNTPDTFFAPILAMLLFVTSALITSLIAFWRPVTLFFIKNKKRRALQEVATTTLFLVFYTLSTLTILVVYS